jgi:hypothetical protein
MFYQLGELIGEAATLPPGAIEISDARYKEIISQKSQGQTVSVINGVSTTYSGDTKTIYQLEDDVVLTQTIPVEEATPNGWQDSEIITLNELKTKKKRRD